MGNPKSAHTNNSASIIIGVLFLSSAILLNQWAVAHLLAANGIIEGRSKIAAILIAQLILGLEGIRILRKGQRFQPPRFLSITLATFGVAATAFGIYGTGLAIGIFPERVRELQEICDWITGQDVPLMVQGGVESREAQLAEIVSEPGQELAVIDLQIDIGTRLLYQGGHSAAIDYLESTYNLIEVQQLPDLLNDTRRELGIAHLHRGRIENCSASDQPAGCALFPIPSSAVWSDPSDALIAIEYFNTFLQHKPDDARVRWLLNLAHMLAGTYPEGVSPAYVIELAAAKPTIQTPHFRDIAPEAGLAAFNPVGGAIMDDFDNDGWLDVVTSTHLPCEPMLYFHNNGDGTFTEKAAQLHLTAQLGGFNLVQADYNNDGLLDIYVMRGAWLREFWGRQRNSLLRQNKDGTFSDVTRAAGLAKVAYPTLAAAWADYNHDGDIDLYVPNEYFPDQLFRNNGDGTFTDIAEPAGINNLENAKGVAWGDYDNDGDSDIYVSNINTANNLFRNNGDDTFTDVAAEVGVATTARRSKSFTPWFWDVNNDGWLDLFVGGYGGNYRPTVLEDDVADFLGIIPRGEQLTLYLNDGTGQFIDVSERMNLDRVFTPMGANYGDIDNDGYPDFYLGTGAPPLDFLVPNRLFQNVNGKQFVDVTTSANVGHLQKGHSIAFGDIDNDGDQDIFAQMGGWVADDAYHNALFENAGNNNHWITIKLVGVVSNHAAIGVRIKLTVDDGGGEREIHVLVSSGGSFGASSLQQEIGLGSADHINTLEIYWPTSGIRQQFDNVAVDQFIEIVEDQAAYRLLNRPIVGQ